MCAVDVMQAMLTVHTSRYANLVGNCVACGGFACRPVRFRVCSHAAVADQCSFPCIYARYRKSAVYFATISVIPILPFVLVVLVSIQTVRRLPLSRCTMKWLLSVVGLCVWDRQDLRGIPDIGQEKGDDIKHPACQARVLSVGSPCLHSHRPSY